jgi:hypothetical protein
MDFAFAYILIAFVTLAVKVAFVLAAAISIFVVLVVLHDHTIAKDFSRLDQQKRRDELH